jgi:hypothetical protein
MAPRVETGQVSGDVAPVRRLHRAVGVLGAVAFGVVVVAPEAVLWQALVPFSRARLALAGGWEFVPPLMFGAAGFAVAVMALRAVLAGRAAVVERFLTFAYAGAGAAVAYWYESSQGRPGAGVVFAGAALSAPLLWDRVLRHLAWERLDEVGAIERPLPRFRLLRWLVDFKNTREAWTTALREGIDSPADALAVVRARREGVPAPAPRVELATPLPELAKLTKAAALRTAWAALNVEVPGSSDVPPAVAWLAERGVTVNESYAYNLARGEQERAVAAARGALQVAGGESR